MNASKPPEKPTELSEHTKAVIEAMRRATEQATTGPRWMRSGRFNPQPEPDIQIDDAAGAMRYTTGDVTSNEPNKRDTE